MYKKTLCIGTGVLLLGIALSARAETANIEHSGAPTATQSSLMTVLAQAQRYLREGEAAQAYELLKPYEPVLAGNPAYDYVYGTAALDSGAADKAIFVLLRVLNQTPNHSGARMELARAYYANRDYDDAKIQFETVLQQNPPVRAKVLAEEYLVAIDDYLETRLNRVMPYIDVRLGYDSNANRATSNEKPFSDLADVPAVIQDLTLQENSTETASAFSSVAVGFDAVRQFKPRYFVGGGVQIKRRSNPSAHFVDSNAVSAYGMLEYRLGNNHIGGAVDVTQDYTKGGYQVSSLGLSLLAGKALSKRWSSVFQLRNEHLSYSQDRDVKDGEENTFSANFKREWAGPHHLNTSIGFIAQETDANTAVNSRSLYGLQAAANFVALRTTLFGFSLAALESDYDAVIVGNEERVDRSYLFATSIARYSRWSQNLKWLLNFDAHMTESSLDLYDSEGLSLSVGARYDFR